MLLKMGYAPIRTQEDVCVSMEISDEYLDELQMPHLYIDGCRSILWRELNQKIKPLVTFTSHPVESQRKTVLTYTLTVVNKPQKQTVTRLNDLELSIFARC